MIEENENGKVMEEKENEETPTEKEVEETDGEVTEAITTDQSGTMGVYDWLQCIVSAVVCGIFVFVFIGRMIGVEQTSMLPTLYEKDRVIMTNLFYTPKNGDIVIIKAESHGETPLVKRVIAVGGQTIDIDFEEGEVTVDGVVLDEPYTNTPTNRSWDFSGPLTIPEGHIFVMGDNRNGSMDSRSSSIWTIDTRNVLGKVLFILIPGTSPEGAREWNRIGSVYR